MARAACIAAALLLVALSGAAGEDPSCPVNYDAPMFGFFASGPARPPLFGGLRDLGCKKNGKSCACDGYWWAAARGGAAQSAGGCGSCAVVSACSLLRAAAAPCHSRPALVLERTAGASPSPQAVKIRVKPGDLVSRATPPPP
jgi:hypothetical protein